MRGTPGIFSKNRPARNKLSLCDFVPHQGKKLLRGEQDCHIPFCLVYLPYGRNMSSILQPGDTGQIVFFYRFCAIRHTMRDFFQHEVKPDVCASAVSLHKRLRGIHLHVFSSISSKVLFGKKQAIKRFPNNNHPNRSNLEREASCAAKVETHVSIPFHFPDKKLIPSVRVL